MNSFLKALRESVPESLRGFRADLLAVDCHHNYVNREFHFGEDLLITRKGAVCAEKGEGAEKGMADGGFIALL